MSSACFLTWIEHRRTRELSRRLNIRLFELVSVHRGIRRYLELIPRTVRVLLHERPVVVVVQSPSVVLAAVALLIRAPVGYRLIIDAHNEAVEPFLHRSLPMLALTRWLLRSADRVIVTNDYLAQVVTEYRGLPLVLTDPLPVAPPIEPRSPSDVFRVAVICTYADDEPFEEIVGAASAAGGEFRFFVTGNPEKLDQSVRRSIPPNMTVTGFLGESDYWTLLASSDVVLDLTTMDKCLVCGAYEGIAAGVPLVLSDNAASVATFRDFAEFTSNNAADIVLALRRLRLYHAEMVARLPAARQEFENRWNRQAGALITFIKSGAGSPNRNT